MAKLIHSLDGVFLGEYAIDKERLSIGRRPGNDIQIDNLAISGQHASILTIGQDSILQDLNSTNGTLVNGQRIVKHVLQHGDVIAFGKFELCYLQQLSPASTDKEFSQTMVLRPSYHNRVHADPAGTSPENLAVASNLTPLGSTSLLPSPIATVSKAKTSTPAASVSAFSKAEAGASNLLANIHVLNGPSIGQQRILNKTLTTLGMPGIQVAVISKRPHGYFITHVEGRHYPLVNAHAIGAQAYALHDHDVIELAGVKMEFYLVSQ